MSELKEFIEDKIKFVKDKVIVLNQVSIRTWIIIGLLFAFLCAFWEWIVGWLGHLVLGEPFFIYPYSSLKYTTISGILSWGLFATICMFIAMQVSKSTAVRNVLKTVKEDYTSIKDFLKGKFVLPKKIPTYYVLIAGLVGAIVGTTCEGLWGFILHFIQGHVTWIYPGSILKYTSFASIPIWGFFSATYFVLTHNLILLLERKQIKNE